MTLQRRLANGHSVNWYTAVFELIDMRSFSNLWYWIALAVLWSTTSRYVLGVPYDMIHRAAREGGEAEQDMETMLRININRLIYIVNVSGLWVLGFAAAVLTSLIMLGFWYHIEFAQAVLLLLAPMSIVGLLSLKAAQSISAQALTGEALRRRLHWHRFTMQVIGMVSILVTALWGMAQNMSIGGLG